ncbi:hypothetical protein [Rubritalea marina]|uniref:hypothetical protein n=1 Tax=Rubritalea marina TaxID=361055 RepID=UPI00035FED15|nr:hypothetical protein [Rubritalea marina]
MKKKHQPLSSLDKALQINLDKEKYGAFAEIGAGQEVVNWFFKTSGTAGTVAKSISAYDMTMSDEIYGKAQRYVSRERVKSMLDHEYDLLIERLAAKRGSDTTFFAYCNTVRARGYQDNDECHGWMGVRLQLTPEAEPCQILCHVRLLDQTNTDQMEALGVIGLNLIYASFYHRDSLEHFVESLLDNLSVERIEVDMLKFLGEEFRYVDNRLCSLQLVKSGLTPAAMFTPQGEVVQPAEVLYAKPVALLRGSFDPVSNLHLDMLEQGKRALQRHLDNSKEREFMSLCEISMNNLLEEGADKLDHLDFLNRADALQAEGQTVLISNYSQFYRVANYLSMYTREPIAFILSVGLLVELFNEKWSSDLDGGVLESFGRLFKHKIKMFAYPWKESKDSEVVTTSNIKVDPKAAGLLQYIIDNDLVEAIESSDTKLLNYSGVQLKEMIRSGNEEWLDYIPKAAQATARRFR